MNWIDQFHSESAPVIGEPFFNCLAEALAIVESGHGRHAIATPNGINEIGYKAVPGHPSVLLPTCEAEADGTLKKQSLFFRLFPNRAEQARSLLYLLRSSLNFEAARLLFVLAFYSAYAPGRTAGLRALLQAYNQRAASGLHEGVRPFAMIGAGGDPDTLHLNHAAARQAVRMFGELTSQP